MKADVRKEEILTINECAEFLKVSPRLIYDLVSEERVHGKIFAKKVGRSWRILRKEVEAYLLQEQSGPYQITLLNNIKQS
jgi:excisionase family DNA binding protein